MQYNKKTYAAQEENGKRRKLALKQEVETFESAYRCEACIARQSVSIPDPVLIQLDLKQLDAQGRIRTAKNSGCVDCRAHERFMENVPDYAALFSADDDDGSGEELLLAILKNPSDAYKVFFDLYK